MKRAVKTDQVYSRLRSAIQAGSFATGSCLPREDRFAAELGISRWTLRQALTQLEKDGLISRTKKRGTTVTMDHTNPVISLLLPCTEGINLTNEQSNAYHLRLLAGASQASARTSLRIETIPVSPTNDPEDIDWIKFRHLSASSKIIVPQAWYTPLAPLLEERGCRVVFIREDTRPENGKYFPNATHIVLETRQAFDQALGALVAAGCRRIALAALPYGDFHEEDPRIHCIFIPRRDRMEAIRQIREAYAAEPFDGLFFDLLELVPPYYGASYHELLGLPPSVRIIVPHEMHANRECRPPMSAINCPLELIGAEAVRLLTQPEFEPRIIPVPMELLLRESSEPLNRFRTPTGASALSIPAFNDSFSL